jgi:hypothetical protein
LVAAATAAGLWAVGCGPSVQLIYEGNLRFEHCYRLDLDEHISPTHRQACWSEWVHYYAKDQTQDRVDYAKRRIEAIRSGDASSLSLQLEEPADAGVIALAADPAPVPTSAHAPPPSRLQALPVEPIGTGGPDAGAEPATPKLALEPNPSASPKRLNSPASNKAPAPTKKKAR